MKLGKSTTETDASLKEGYRDKGCLLGSVANINRYLEIYKCFLNVTILYQS